MFFGLICHGYGLFWFGPNRGWFSWVWFGFFWFWFLCSLVDFSWIWVWFLCSLVDFSLLVCGFWFLRYQKHWSATKNQVPTLIWFFFFFTECGKKNFGSCYEWVLFLYLFCYLFLLIGIYNEVLVWWIYNGYCFRILLIGIYIDIANKLRTR